MKNNEIKLQETIGQMQEMGTLISNVDAQAASIQSQSVTKQSIIALKQNILNQTNSAIDVQTGKIADPPMRPVKKDDKVVFVVDERALGKLQAELNILRAHQAGQQFAIENAAADASAAKLSAAEKTTIKNILESEVDQLNAQASSLADQTRSERKSPAYERDKESNYFKSNLHVTDFEKAIQSNSGQSSHFQIGAVNESDS